MIDLLIIGSGPAGLSAAVYAKRSNLDVMVAEKEFLGTGQIAGSIRVDNYLGSFGLSGYELGESFRHHAEELRVPFYTGEAVSIRRSPGGWKTEFYGGEILEARTIIFAGGTVPRSLNVPGEQELAGRGVSSCVVCDGPLYRDKTTAVVGGGDTALDSALYLADMCKKVYLIHWRKDFRGNHVTLEKLKERDNVEIIRNAAVKTINGTDIVSSITLTNGRLLKVDGLFKAIGSDPGTALVKDIVRLDAYGYILAGEDCSTTADGFFVAGDVRTKRLRQISTAVADGANAVFSAIAYLKANE